MRVSRRLAVLVAGLICLPLLAAAPSVAAGSPPVPLPSSPKGLKASVALPKAVDPPAAYRPQVACDPTDKDGAVKLRALLLKTYPVGASAGISRGCTEGVSEHSEGRAVDWMVDTRDPKQKAAAADFLAWATRNNGENARRLGIMYLIYNEKIWAIYRSSEGWRPSSGHTDHIHITLSWNGARATTSFWTGKVHPVDVGPCVRYSDSMGTIARLTRTAPCPTSVTSVKGSTRGRAVYGTSGSSTVKRAQQLLGRSQTGTFDYGLWRALRDWQVANDLPHTGILDEATWSALDPGTIDRNSVSSYTRAKAISAGATWRTTYAREAVGTNVAIIQIALGMPVKQQNGYYGGWTVAAVKKLQARAKLTQDGVMGADEWKVLVRG